jgi:hypothetical protein
MVNMPYNKDEDDDDELVVTHVIGTCKPCAKHVKALLAAAAAAAALEVGLL